MRIGIVVNHDYTEWYENGQKEFEGHYRNGEEVPGSKSWDENGNKK
jgi:antitoxin component YwqK of YwqJK toxin-antitoxin module